MNTNLKRIVAAGAIVILAVSTISFPSRAEDSFYLMYGGYLEELGEEYGVSPELLQAIVFTESSYDNSKTNGTCYGYMQINGAVWGYEYTSPKENLRKGTEILMEYAAEYGDIAYVLDKYNGSNEADANYENGIVSEYATKVTDLSYLLEEEHGKHNY